MSGVGSRIIDGWQGSVEKAALLEGIKLAAEAFRSLEKFVPPLQWVEWKEDHNWQYVERLPSQAIVQKLARQISSSIALELLLSRGFLQEVGSMQRMLDEIGEDIAFLSLGLSTGLWTANHDTYLSYFWGEGGGQLGVQRKTIRAYNHRAFPELVDPSSADKNGRDLYQIFSDYLHARSSTLVGMVSGPPPQHHLDGITDPRATRPYRDQAASYGYRCLMSAAYALRAVENGPAADRVYHRCVAYGVKYDRMLHP